MVTLNIHGPVRLLILMPTPDDPAVKRFLDVFVPTVAPSGIPVEQVECRNGLSLYGSLATLQQRYDYNCLMILAHGGPDHRVLVDDPQQTSESLREWAVMFPKAFDDRLVILAVCHSGNQLVTDRLFRVGMALHVLTPSPDKPELDVDLGASALAYFLGRLAEKRKGELTPDDLCLAMSDTERAFPRTLTLCEPTPDFDFQ